MENKEIMHHKNLALIGLGPHAEQTYMEFLNQYQFSPKLIVELQNKEETVKRIINEKHFENIEFLFIPDEQANLEELSVETKRELHELLVKNQISHAVISTEPKAHFAYSKFLIEEGINILMDKPIVAPIDVISKISSAQSIQEQYNQICELYHDKSSEMQFKIQCQRRHHIGYMYIKNLLERMVKEYNIPISYIDMYHCDGMWNMPDEFISRENHPYKYGYGKMFHSGYHFADLLAWFLEANSYLKDKQINHAKLYGSTYRPKDFLHAFNKKDYENFFHTNRYDEIFENTSIMDNYGEIDYHAMIDFKDHDKLITHCTLDLLQSGFSRRAWLDLPVNTFTGNGRVSHERVNIQIGPLMNIQVHSYNAYTKKESEKYNSDQLGGGDHCEITIYRNSDLIGGPTLETKTLQQIAGQLDKTTMGANPRKNSFQNFLSNKIGDNDILKEKNTILLVEKMYENLASGQDSLDFGYTCKQ